MTMMNDAMMITLMTNYASYPLHYISIGLEILLMM